MPNTAKTKAGYIANRIVLLRYFGLIFRTNFSNNITPITEPIILVIKSAVSIPPYPVNN